MSKATVPGLTLDMHANFRNNLVTMIPKMDSKVTVTDLPDH